MKKSKNKAHYVNNKQFLEEMVKYRDKVHEASKLGKERPLVTHYIGECLMKIAVHLSHKPNFVNYTFKEEMISDGIENCLQYIDNFNPEKSQNPFAYFTQIIYYAFLRRIAKEKKHLYTKYKMIDEVSIHNPNEYADQMNNNKTSEWNRDYIDTFIETFEETKRKKKRGIVPVDMYMSGEDS